ncbi:MAG: hypothetical protein KBC62_01465 [Candidatus Pacebacteria bacterium]|nr:hypothetical protein [Candidatus Paceibacterota bacterium]MBP9842652.1 hypothetical protein [Candidatus Paceibacterota bacterium]
MPNSPNTSFIPKQGPIRRPRQTASRSVHLFSIISYIALASAMVASVGSFFYGRHVEGQLQDKVEELSQAIAGFNEEDMNQVREFNVRLTQSRDRLDNGVSLRSVFEALEDATAQTVALSSLKLERFADDSIVLAAKVETDNFDSSLFQRGVFERSNIVESVAVEDLMIIEETDVEDGPVRSGVSFVAEITVPISEVPNVPGETLIPVPEPVVIETPVASTTEDEPMVDEENVTDTNEVTP